MPSWFPIIYALLLVAGIIVTTLGQRKTRQQRKERAAKIEKRAEAVSTSLIRHERP